jgi:hypothetical protein
VWRDDVFAGSYPALAGWLGETVTEEGAVRQTGTILLFVEGSWVKCCLTDRQSGWRCFLSAVSFEDLLTAADGGLAAGSLDWRPSKPLAGGRPAR